jgi:hypothetical protein
MTHRPRGVRIGDDRNAPYPRCMERLRYSDRRQLAEQGSLGPLAYGAVPEKLTAAVVSIYQHAARQDLIGGHFDKRVLAACEQHFGRTFWGVNSPPRAGGRLQDFLQAKYPSPITILDFLDVIEILAEEGPRSWTFTLESGNVTRQADGEIEQHINAVFVRHRFGYRLSSGEVRRIGSPAMDEAVVGPALLATSRPGWEQVDRSYRDALHHRRGGPGERGAAITDAHAALEAALKTAGLKGDTLAALAKSFRNSGLVLPLLEGVPELLDKLLKRSQSMRDSLSDAHGREPGTEEVPIEVVDLAIHWTGAFIVYLADATRN